MTPRALLLNVTLGLFALVELAVFIRTHNRRGYTRVDGVVVFLLVVVLVLTLGPVLR